MYSENIPELQLYNKFDVNSINKPEITSHMTAKQHLAIMNETVHRSGTRINQWWKYLF